MSAPDHDHRHGRATGVVGSTYRIAYLSIWSFGATKGEVGVSIARLQVVLRVMLSSALVVPKLMVTRQSTDLSRLNRLVSDRY